MSDIPDRFRDPLDLRAIIAKIDRDRAEDQKLQEETKKFVAEQRKLIAEASKLDRDRWLAPFVIVASLLGAVVVALIGHFWK